VIKINSKKVLISAPFILLLGIVFFLFGTKNARAEVWDQCLCSQRNYTWFNYGRTSNGSSGVDYGTTSGSGYCDDPDSSDWILAEGYDPYGYNNTAGWGMVDPEQAYGVVWVYIPEENNDATSAYYTLRYDWIDVPHPYYPPYSYSFTLNQTGNGNSWVMVPDSNPFFYYIEGITLYANSSGADNAKTAFDDLWIRYCDYDNFDSSSNWTCTDANWSWTGACSMVPGY